MNCPNCQHKLNDWSLPRRYVRVQCDMCQFDTGDVMLEPGDDAETVLRAVVTGTRRAYASLNTLRRTVGLE